MFDPDRPIARRSDPNTSKVAAHAYTESGARDSDKHSVLQAIIENPGCTSRELAHILKENGTLAWDVAVPITTKRTSDLIRDGKIITGKPRKCKKSKRLARPYYAKADVL